MPQGTPATSIEMPARRQPDRRLELSQVLADLAADALIDAQTAEQLAKDRRFARSDIHPLVVVAVPPLAAAAALLRSLPRPTLVVADTSGIDVGAVLH